MEWRDLIDLEPRHPFLSENFIKDASKNVGVPIGHGLTASKPSTVARMLTLLGSRKRVLEVGTGCGWQTALLTHLAKEVYSIECCRSLYERAARSLSGYPASLKCGDGGKGWPDKSPFDGIIVSCAIEKTEPLTRQLDVGGVLVAPVGNGKSQTLVLIENTGNGLVSSDHGPCGFSLIKEN